MVYPRRKNQSIYQSQVNGKYKSRHIQTFLTVEVKKKKNKSRRKNQPNTATAQLWNVHDFFEHMSTYIQGGTLQILQKLVLSI